VNGIGTNSLRSFGLISSDVNPTIDVSQCYITVNYSNPAYTEVGTDPGEGTLSGWYFDETANVLKIGTASAATFNITLPVTLTLTGTDPTDTGLDLSWNPYTAGDFVKYEVYRGTSPSFSQEQGALLATITDYATYSYTDTSASVGATYYYAVFLTTAGGVTKSNEVTLDLPLYAALAEASADAISPTYTNDMRVSATVANAGADAPSGVSIQQVGSYLDTFAYAVCAESVADAPVPTVNSTVNAAIAEASAQAFAAAAEWVLSTATAICAEAAAQAFNPLVTQLTDEWVFAEIAQASAEAFSAAPSDNVTHSYAVVAEASAMAFRPLTGGRPAARMHGHMTTKRLTGRMWRK
jgi:hypothetical protein